MNGVSNRRETSMELKRLIPVPRLLVRIDGEMQIAISPARATTARWRRAGRTALAAAGEKAVCRAAEAMAELPDA